MLNKIKIGVVCLARKTFDFNAAKNIYEKKQQELNKRNDIDFIFEEDLVIEINDVEKAIDTFNKNAVDAVIVISGTFHLGHLAVIINNKIKKPILLWAFNELPYDGGKIRLNSVCGLNLNASNLYKAGNDTFHYNVSNELDEDWIRALKIKTALEKTKIGLIGSRAHGFFNLGFDELHNSNQTGVLIDYYQISELYSEKFNDDEFNHYKNEIKNNYDCSYVSEDQINKVSALTASIKNFVEKNNLNALAIRCWPEFASDFGISPCAAMSYLQSKDYILGCEGDVQGAMSLIAAKTVSNSTPFLADLSQVNLEENYALMWHCGVAACNLWDGKSNISLDSYFAGGKGVTADFVMKSGVVTIVRIDSARGEIRLFVSKGEAIEMKKELKGTYAKVKFDKHIKDLLDVVVTNGIAHHVAMVYGDYTKSLKIYSKLMGWKYIE